MRKRSSDVLGRPNCWLPRPTAAAAAHHHDTAFKDAEQSVPPRCQPRVFTGLGGEISIVPLRRAPYIAPSTVAGSWFRLADPFPVTSSGKLHPAVLDV